MPVNLNPILNNIINGILDIFSSYFNNVTDICLKVIDSGDKNKIPQLNDHMYYILK